MVTILTSIHPTMNWHVENKLQSYTYFHAIAVYWIASQRIPVEIHFNTIVMILSQERQIRFQSFKLNEEE